MDIGDYDKVLSGYEQSSRQSYQALSYAHELMLSQFQSSSRASTSAGNGILDYAVGGLRNLLMSSIEMSDFVKYNIKNLAIGNLPNPPTFEWET